MKRRRFDAGSARVAQDGSHDRRATRGGLVLLALFVAILACGVLPAVASAESLCTDTWVGPEVGNWDTAGDWSMGNVPGSTDVACVGSGKTVEVTEGVNHAAVVQGQGAIDIFKGSLEVTSSLESSVIASLAVDGGTLTGAGSVYVSSSLLWLNSTSKVSGSGSLVVEKGASGKIEGNLEKFSLAGRTLINEGMLTLAGGNLELSEGAIVRNVGTFDLTTAKGIYGETVGSAPVVVNSGVLERTESTSPVTIQPKFENTGTVSVTTGKLLLAGGGSSGTGTTWQASEGAEVEFTANSFVLSGASVTGHFAVHGATVTTEKVETNNVTLYDWSGSLVIASGSMTVNSLVVSGGTLTGAGSVYVSGSFLWQNSTTTLSGSGSLVLQKGVSGKIEGNLESFYLSGRTFVNEGTITLSGGTIRMSGGAVLKNTGTFDITTAKGISSEGSPAGGLVVNTGRFEKTNEVNTATIEPYFENYGTIAVVTGKLEIENPVIPAIATRYGSQNLSSLGELRMFCGDPVDCVTGNYTEAQTDLSVGGRGVGLNLTRTYNAQAAAQATSAGSFGYGWAGAFSDHLVVESASHKATLYQANGSTATFTESGGTFTAPAWSGDTLTGSTEAGYTVTLANQTAFHFNGTSGRLEGESDRNGNQTTLSYNEKGQLTTITDPASRKLTLAYNAEGMIESATDPMGHAAKYTYEGGNLASVTLPGETGPRWRFKYDASHRLTIMIDGRGGETTNTYDSSNRLTSQKDPLGHVLKFEYEPFQTKITNEATGAVTLEQYNSSDMVTSVTRGYGTSSATTTKMVYNERNELTSSTDGNGHTTTYEYDGAGNRTKLTDPGGRETTWTYNSTHDVLMTTRPNGETTTIERDAHGNPTVISRPAPGSTTQTTKYTYDSHGDVESVTDPLSRKWVYEYNGKGDRTSETDPEGDKRTWGYNEDSQQTSTVSPRGSVTGGEPAAFTTTFERDQQGRPVTVVEPPREPGYNFAFGSSGSGNGQFQFPTLEALTSSGNVWVADSTLDRLQEFNEKGEYLAQFGSQGTGVGQFNFPFGIGINASSGNIYVSDRNNYRVQEFSANGTFVRTFGYGVSDGEAKFEICTANCRVGLKGSGAGQFSAPDGVAIDASGNVWVVDEVNNRLEEFKENGEFLHQYGTKGTGNGQLSQPVAIAYDNGNLYVTEATNERVQEFSTAGAYVAKFGSEGTGNGQFKVPYAIAAGPTTNELYVTDRENNRVQIFTAAGRFLSSFGSKGKGNAQMELPTGVVANASEVVYVSDHGNKRVDDWTGLTSRVTKYAYDADGNVETRTDPNGNKTKYTYDADNEQTKIEAANGTITETAYDGAGQVVSQTDANKHTTKYVRNALEQVIEAIDPLARKTTKEYDLAGNLKTLTDPAKRTTSYTYDTANRLVEVKYSDGKTPTAKYEYDKNGNRTVTTDGTGTSANTYDQLDRLTEAKDGHGDVTKYEYDLANQQTTITYPNGKTVTQTYDKAGRLEKVTDWLSNVTKFAYDPDSNLTSTAFPAGTSNEDVYAYNLSDQISEVKTLKGTETPASLIYARDSNGQINRTISKGLPGNEITETVYDANNRLTKAGSTAYEYDPANNPTKIGASTYKYDSASELESGTGATYAYDEMGERTKTTPPTGPATTYGYDQAGNLTSVTRPKEGETAAIEDTYAYDGTGLRASQAISGTTSYLTWNATARLPLILNDGVNSYIYGPGGVPLEQINSEGKVQYLHHDQAGSTRLITGGAGTVEGAYTYTPYGSVEGHTGTATTPLGYDGQYTSSDTGLIYLRARAYDPATAQFMSVDPLLPVTRASYTYAGDNPLTYSDPTGLDFFEEAGEAIAGWGDTITFGATKWVREELGINNVLSCSTAYQLGGYGAVIVGVLLPEDLGPQLFQQFAQRFPKLAASLVRQQAYQQVSQPGKLTIVKAVLEKLRHLVENGS